MERRRGARARRRGPRDRPVGPTVEPPGQRGQRHVPRDADVRPRRRTLAARGSAAQPDRPASGCVMKLVLHLSDFGWPIEPAAMTALLSDVAGLAEDGGFGGIAVADHVWSHPIMGGPETACLEAYTTLAFLAAH